MKKVILTALCFALIGGGVTAYWVTTKTTSVMSAIAPPEARVEVSPLMIIKAMEEKYETITFSMYLSTEVTAGRCDGMNWLQDWLHRDCLKMTVPADVSAGFGKDILNPSRITATKDAVNINLGTPTIYRPNIDHTNVIVHNQEDDGGVWSDPDKNLQAKGFVEAEKKLRVAACTAGIYKAAALSAEKHYGDLFQRVLMAAGDKRTVSIVYQLPSCQ